MDGVRARMAPLLGRLHLARPAAAARCSRRSRAPTTRRCARCADGRSRERLGARVEHAVAALQLRAVDGEVGLVDQLVRVGAVARERGDADRDRRADRLARRLDLEGVSRDRLADPLRDLERLLGGGLRQQDAELLAAEARRHVVVAQVARGRPRRCPSARRRPARWPYVLLISRRRSRSAMTSASGRSNLAERASSSFSADAKWRALKRPGLRVDARLRLELGHAQRAVDQQERARPRTGSATDSRSRTSPARRRAPPARARSTGCGSVKRPGVPDRVPAREVEHRREQQVVGADDHDRGGDAGEREAEVLVRHERRRSRG